MRFLTGATRNNAQKFSWWLDGGNSRMVAWAGQTWDTPEDAEAAATEFKATVLSARFDVYLDDGKQWRWRAWDGTEKVASSGEAFDNKQNAERAAENVRDNAGTATGP